MGVERGRGPRQTGANDAPRVVDLTMETATMSGLTMIVIGLVLGLAGGWSIRTVLMLVGFGAGWLLANVSDANLLVTGGWLAEKTKERFVAWGTSIGGAALVLAGRTGRE